MCINFRLVVAWITRKFVTLHSALSAKLPTTVMKCLRPIFVHLRSMETRFCYIMGKLRYLFQYSTYFFHFSIFDFLSTRKQQNNVFTLQQNKKVRYCILPGMKYLGKVVSRISGCDRVVELKIERYRVPSPVMPSVVKIANH